MVVVFMTYAFKTRISEPCTIMCVPYLSTFQFTSLTLYFLCPNIWLDVNDRPSQNNRMHTWQLIGYTDHINGYQSIEKD